MGNIANCVHQRYTKTWSRTSRRGSQSPYSVQGRQDGQTGTRCQNPGSFPGSLGLKAVGCACAPYGQSFLNVQQQPRRLFQFFFDRHQPQHRLAPVNQTMIVRQRQIHH